MSGCPHFHDHRRKWLDIPRANTILINRADRFGLSELYQLRGRVGRSNQRAYAYLLVPEDVSLTPLATRGSRRSRKFAPLSGFRVAALDLELRGAGNLLGASSTATSTRLDLISTAR